MFTLSRFGSGRDIDRSSVLIHTFVMFMSESKKDDISKRFILVTTWWKKRLWRDHVHTPVRMNGPGTSGGILKGWCTWHIQEITSVWFYLTLQWSMSDVFSTLGCIITHVSTRVSVLFMVDFFFQLIQNTNPLKIYAVRSLQMHKTATQLTATFLAHSHGWHDKSKAQGDSTFYLQIKLYVFSLKMETHQVWVSELVMYEVRC